MADDDIIDRTPSSPIATACTIISTVALLGAIIVQIMEIGEIRSDLTEKYLRAETPAKAMLSDEQRRIEDKKRGILETNTAGDEGLPHADAADNVDDMDDMGDGDNGDGDNGDDDGGDDDDGQN